MKTCKNFDKSLIAVFSIKRIEFKEGQADSGKVSDKNIPPSITLIVAENQMETFIKET